MTIFDNTSQLQAVLEKVQTQPTICEITDYTAKYLEGTLATFTDSTAFKVRENAFSNLPLMSFTLEACETIESSAFANCSILTRVSLPKCTFIAEKAFTGCTKLSSIYLPGSVMCSLGNSNAFTNFYGKIYVPSDMISTYKVAANWSYYSNRFSAI